jgi:hypothetical protein
MEAPSLFEMFGPMYRITWCHIAYHDPDITSLQYNKSMLNVVSFLRSYGFHTKASYNGELTRYYVLVHPDFKKIRSVGLLA